MVCFTVPMRFMISARCRMSWRSSSCAAFTTCCAELLLACALIAFKPSLLFFSTSINASSSKHPSTLISNTRTEPPKFHHDLDSFAEERLSEKRGEKDWAVQRGHSCPRTLAVFWYRNNSGFVSGHCFSNAGSLQIQTPL